MRITRIGSEEIGNSFIYKGNKYVVERDTSFKHPETREWILAFIYKNIGTGEIFVRSQDEFLEKFKRIDNELDK